MNTFYGGKNSYRASEGKVVEVPYKGKLKDTLEKHGFQTRPIVTGNILRHPVSRFFPAIEKELPNADKIHNNGLYIGNYFSSSEDSINDFSNAINSLKF